ncbi:hypothetical protein CBA19CS42_26530 [Caballeronia novacaledonica]|uniref:Uncharacterized protein n=1 Tax=Caballeronia novacaledonica TaxID=1544861 RepID=A0AA37IF78_9BURK|nr:hypothetical protein CBA19CS42_26530 [Caballeronia novacaledonica]
MTAFETACAVVGFGGVYGAAFVAIVLRSRGEL